MTTFQYIIEAGVGALAAILPIPRSLLRDFGARVLGWGDASPELLLLVLGTVTLYLLFFFRYDFLGILSALIKSIFKPTSLGNEQRTLDQHILLFLLIVIPFAFLGSVILHGELALVDSEILRSPITHLAAYLVTAFGFQFSRNWNKRIKGLNHIRLIDAFLIAGLSLLTAYEPISWVAVLWIGFASTNYHYEAIFKYTYILVTLLLLNTVGGLLRSIPIGSAMQTVGYLNAIAVIAVSLTTVYMLLEHLERTLGEGTYKNARNWCILCAVFYGVLIFI
jgi:hypothetical protein